MYRKLLAASAIVAFLSFPEEVLSWMGKTHKWLAQEAVEFLPQDEKSFFEDYRTSLFKGCVDADKYRRKHHVYFSDNRRVIDDSAASFARDRGEEAIRIIHEARKKGVVTERDKQLFAELSGCSVHLVSDMHGLHTVSDEDQLLHTELEREVDSRVGRVVGEGFYSSDFDLRFDGTLRKRDPYTAVIEMARLSHFGKGKILSAVELQDHIPMGKYGDGTYTGFSKWDLEIRMSVQRTLNRQANLSAEVLNYLYIRAFVDPIDVVALQNAHE